jgi:hypothetical protein
MKSDAEVDGGLHGWVLLRAARGGVAASDGRPCYHGRPEMLHGATGIATNGGL